MFHLFDTVTNGDKALSGFRVLLRDAPGGTIVPIFADQSGTPIVAVSSLANIAVTDPVGNYSLFVPEGTYTIEFRTPLGAFVRSIEDVPMTGGPKGDKGDKGDDGLPGAPGGNPDPRIVYTRLIPGYVSGGDNTPVIQAVLDTFGAAGTPLTLIQTEMVNIGQLRVWSNTTFLSPARGAGFKQTAGYPGPMFLNKHPTRGVFENTEAELYGLIQDSGIAFIGGTYDGNFATHNNIRGTANNFRNIISMYAVRGLVIDDVRFQNPGAYNVHVALCDGATITRCRFDIPNAGDGTTPIASGYNRSGRNGDGIHVTGPSRDIFIQRVSGRAGDDMIALTADDGGNFGPKGMYEQEWSGPFTGQGAIRRVRIDDVNLAGSLYGLRILSMTNRVEDVEITNVRGTTYGIAFHCNAYKEAGGPGNGDIGRVTVDGWVVKPLDYISGDPAQPDRASDNRLISLGATIEDFTIRNSKRLPCAVTTKTHYQWLDVDPNSIIGSLSIDGLVIRNVNGEDLKTEGIVRLQRGYSVGSFAINAVDWQRDSTVPRTGALVDAQGVTSGSTVGYLNDFRATNIRANRTSSLLRLRDNGRFGTAQIDDIIVKDVEPGQGILQVFSNVQRPVVTIGTVLGAPSLVGESIEAVAVAVAPPERVTFRVSGEAVSSYLAKSDTIASVTRSGPGVFVVNHPTGLGLANIRISLFGVTTGFTARGEFTSATQTTIRVFGPDINTPADAPQIAVVLDRGGYVS